MRRRSFLKSVLVTVASFYTLKLPLEPPEIPEGILLNEKIVFMSARQAGKCSRLAAEVARTLEEWFVGSPRLITLNDYQKAIRELGYQEGIATVNMNVVTVWIPEKDPARREAIKQILREHAHLIVLIEVKELHAQDALPQTVTEVIEGAPRGEPQVDVVEWRRRIFDDYPEEWERPVLHRCERCRQTLVHPGYLCEECQS